MTLRPYVLAGVGGSGSRPISGDLVSLSTGSGDGFGGDLKTTPLFAIGAGVELPYNLRSDATVSYRNRFHVQNSQTDPATATNFAASSTNSSNWTAMLNLYYDVDTNAPLRPYVGGGVGFARNSLGSITYTANGVFSGSEAGQARNGVAWAGMAGLSATFAENWVADLGYRYLSAGSYRSSGVVTDSFGATSSDNVVKASLKANEIEFSVRYRF